MIKHLLFWLFSLPSIVQAQWTLQQCVDSALQNNLEILQSYHDVENARNIYWQSRWNRFPSLNANASQNFNFGRALDQSTYQFNDRRSATNNFSLNSGLVVFNGGQIKYTILENEWRVVALDYDLQDIKNQVSLDVINAFIQLLYAGEAVKNAELQTASTQELIRQTSIFVEAGKKAESDIAQLQAQFAAEKYEVAAAVGNRRNASLVLQQLMETPYDENFSIIAPQIDEMQLLPLPASADIYAIAVLSQPSVKSTEAQVEAERTALKVTRSAMYPRLSFNAGLNTNFSNLSKLSHGSTETSLEKIGFLKNNMNEDVVSYIERTTYTAQPYPFFQQLSDKFNQSLSLNLSIPIFNARQVRYAIRQQEVRIKTMELYDRINKNNLRKIIEQATVNAAGAQMKYTAASEALKYEEITYGNLQLLFEVSKATAVELLVEKNKLSVATSQLLQAKYDLALKLKVLDYYMGKPLYVE